MKLNHLDLQVDDVPRAVAFFERFFDFECTSNRASEALAFLSDRHGFVFVVQRKKDEATYPKDFHIGFLVDDEGDVLRTHARAHAEGLECSEILQNGRGTMIYLRSPDGFLIEVRKG